MVLIIYIQINEIYFKAVTFPLFCMDINYGPFVVRKETKFYQSGGKVRIKVFRLKEDEVGTKFGILRNKELRDLHTSPGVARIVKSRRLLRDRHAARIEGIRITT
jgi:hypothetical protein